jgi:hypothetical protein
MTAPTTAPALTGARAKALVAYVGLSGLLLLLVWAAFYFAGSGIFGTSRDDDVLDVHRFIAEVLIGLASLLLLISVIVARPGRVILGGTVVLFILIHLQPLFAEVDNRWVGGLHVLDAGIILVLTLLLHLAARRVPRA